MDTIISNIITVLAMPLQLILIPFDMLLSQINGIEAIPQALSDITQFFTTIPETIVKLLGINPILWNGLFLTFVLYYTLAPSIQIVKKIVAWIRG